MTRTIAETPDCHAGTYVMDNRPVTCGTCGKTLPFGTAPGVPPAERLAYANGYEFAWREAIEWFESRLFSADQLPPGSERVLTESQVRDARERFWRDTEPDVSGSDRG